MRRNPRAVYVLACGLAGVVPSLSFAALANHYKGADAVLRQMAAAGGQPGKTIASPGEQWVADWTSFPERTADLAPQKMAEAWVDLASRYLALSAEDLGALRAVERRNRAYDGESRNPLLTVLPGPAAWPALAKLVEARPAQTTARGQMGEAALRLLASTLMGDTEGQRKAVDAMSKIKGRFSSLMENLGVDSLEEALLEQTGDTGAVKAVFEAKVKAFQERIKVPNPFRNSSYLSHANFAVPDLVTILGSETEAEPLLKEAILLPAHLTVEGIQTKRLAAKLALEMVASLKQPCWELAASLEGAPLYEALDAQFPDSGEGTPEARDRSPDFSTARNYYFLHLIVSGQTAKAIELAEAISRNSSLRPNLPTEDLEKAGYINQVCDFLHDLLTKHPEYSFWNEYIRLAAKAGKTDQMLPLIRKAAAAPVTPGADGQARSGSATRSFYLALLSADQIDEGITELRKIIAADEATENSRNGNSSSSALGKEIALARLGQLLGREDLLEEGIAAVKKRVAENLPEGEFEDLTSFAELLVQTGRGAEAEEFLGRILGHFQAEPGQSNSLTRQACLAMLVRVYYLAGRPDDVLGVLRKFPGWGASDLNEMLGRGTDGYSLAEFYAHAAPDSLPVAYMAAWAFAQHGQKEEALKITNALLDRQGGFDPAFALLTKISGQQAVGRLDELARRDRFEERPLIWKAQLQLDAGQLDEAEKTIRAAIEIDPSDGEQGPGRRMRAYAVLADVLEKKGDKEHAETYRGAVAAIRISEHADRFYEAGLLTRAVKMYQEALTHFADAYCIQSRLALRLSELGDNAGAEEYYRRAYELMPVSFGRVESHCFGCERAFAGHRAQSIAEKVFTQLSVKMPGKPQVHYLLGYLHMEEGRDAEALPEYEQAVKLDPDYLNAWKEIGSIGERMDLPPKLSNEVALNQARLDPLQRHGSPNGKGVTDLAGLWQAVAAGASLEPPPAGPLLALTASAEEIKKVQHIPDEDERDASDDDENGHAPKPVDSIERNRFIKAADRVLTASAEWPAE